MKLKCVWVCVFQLGTCKYVEKVRLSFWFYSTWFVCFIKFSVKIVIYSRFESTLQYNIYIYMKFETCAENALLHKYNNHNHNNWIHVLRINHSRPFMHATVGIHQAYRLWKQNRKLNLVFRSIFRKAMGKNMEIRGNERRCRRVIASYRRKRVVYLLNERLNFL